jgi:hypothetical protein
MHIKCIKWTTDGKRPKAISSFLSYPGYYLEFEAKFETEATGNYIMRSLLICTSHSILIG